MKVALICDQHFGCRSDSLVFLKQFKKFYDETFFPYLEKNDIKTIIDLGDTFDRRKFINTHTFNQSKEMWFDRIEHEDYDLICIVGNHNTYYRSTNKINNLQTYLEGYKNILIYPEIRDIFVGGKEITIVPWINSENYDSTLAHLKKTKCKIALGHLELGGFVMHRGGVALGGMDVKYFKKFKLVCSGHFHHKQTQGNINYLGSPYEITWSDYNDQRGFHILDTDTLELEFIKNPNKMFYKVFYDDDDKSFDHVEKMDMSHLEGKYVKVVIINKKDVYMFDKFMDKLYNSNPEKVQIVEDHHNLDQLNASDIVSDIDDTLTILNEHVKLLKIKHISKPKLQHLFTTLYNEAQNMEIE